MGYVERQKQRAECEQRCGRPQVDDVEGMEGRFVQIQGKERAAVEAAGKALGLEGTYIPKSYIEQARPGSQERVPSWE